MTPPLTQERLRHLLDYDPATGTFRWRSRSSSLSRVEVGDVAGYVDTSTGYARIGIGGREYKAHRLAWLYVHGRWPANQIDHVNGDKLDNRLDNLREADQRTNNENLRRAQRHNKTGLLGVSHRGSRFEAQITIDSKQLYLGRFDTAEQAHAEYVKVKRLLHAGGML